ncbi:hypothetical protein N7505_009829 [Penicillium chrysogenum]|uniref:Uncharacterized protein n=1 Tax=Penicillium chrysogenum TaxID=5076 RepID=A0ABQ8W958_PENCH|nr:hypothetical protein N7505_009829 [Penicillium chrysogenum]
MANRFCRCGVFVRYRDGRINQVAKKSEKHRPNDDLVVLARAALLSTSLNCIYDPGSKKC